MLLLLIQQLNLNNYIIYIYFNYSDNLLLNDALIAYNTYVSSATSYISHTFYSSNKSNALFKAVS